MSSKKISILLATHNKSRFLDLTLAAYTLQTYKDFELVIVDDGSTDNTSEIINKYKDELDIRYLPQNRDGISKARSKTLENTNGEYVIITDDDRIPCKNFVIEHKKRLDAEEKIVVIGKECLILSHFTHDTRYAFKDEFKIYNKYPELLDCEEKVMFTADDIKNDFDAVIDNFYLSDYTESCLLNMVERYGEDLDGFYLAWSKAFGGNMSFDMRYLEEPLLYDHNYKGYGIEDIDFSYQLFRQGYRFVFSSQAINYHQEHPRGKMENRDMFRNFKYFCEKYPNVDVSLMKMDWDGIIPLEIANDFYRVLVEHKGELEEGLKKELISNNYRQFIK